VFIETEECLSKTNRVIGIKNKEIIYLLNLKCWPKQNLTQVQHSNVDVSIFHDRNSLLILYSNS